MFSRISKEDIVAALKFIAITLVVLFLLPNGHYGPSGLEVLNPHSIGLFVLFISGIGFVSYVLIKLIGPGKGIGLTGFLGGLASSTALTLNLSDRSKKNESFADNFAMGIVLSWTIMYIRLYAICVFLSPALAGPLAVPLLVPAVPGLGYTFYLMAKSKKKETVSCDNFSNPFELLPAIKFGLIFTAVMFLANAVRVYFGDGALLACSFLGGFAEMDAVAFSVLDMTIESTLPVGQLILALLLASLANNLTKGGLVFFLGAKSMRKPVATALLLICGVTGVLLSIYF